MDYTWDMERPWVGAPKRPLITEVNVSIKVLGDDTGERPEYLGGDYNYFGD